MWGIVKGGKCKAVRGAEPVRHPMKLKAAVATGYLVVSQFQLAKTMVQIFTLPYREQAGRYGVKRRNASAKRDDHDDSGLSSGEDSRPASTTATPSRRASPTPTTASLPSSPSSPSSSSTPPPPFPHRAKPSRQPLTANLSRQANPIALRRQHISNLTTILHVSLGREDYARANRAWALLLRTKPGHAPSVDIRQDDRWKIGVELLLWRGAVEGRAEERRAVGERVDGEGPREELGLPRRLTRRLFAPVKEYYQRLILEYTPKAKRPNALDFYPAMYACWVRSIAEEFQDLRRPIVAQMERARLEAAEEGAMDVDGGESGGGEAEGVERLGRLYSDELAEIRGLMLAIDDVVLVPPYSDDEQLTGLRASVGQWADETERRIEHPLSSPVNSSDVLE